VTRAVISRRALAAFGAGGLLGSATGSAAPTAAVRLSSLRWTGSHPTFPVFRALSSGAFEGAVEVRIATRADPLRYKAHLAFARLSSVLERSITPRAEAYAIPLAGVLAAVADDAAGRALLREEMAVLNDGTVTVLVSDVVRGREVELAGYELRSARAWAETVAAVPGDRLRLVGAYVDTLVLDYLAGNVRRTTVVLDGEGATLWAVENGGAFVERVDPAALDGSLQQLKHITRFSRTLAERLRRVRRSELEAALHAGGFATWLVATRPIDEMLERSRVVQSLFAARAAEAGVVRALGLP
jgi:hypothetical protein